MKAQRKRNEMFAKWDGRGMCVKKFRSNRCLRCRNINRIFKLCGYPQNLQFFFLTPPSKLIYDIGKSPIQTTSKWLEFSSWSPCRLMSRPSRLDHEWRETKSWWGFGCRHPWDGWMDGWRKTFSLCGSLNNWDPPIFGWNQTWCKWWSILDRFRLFWMAVI